MFSLTFLVLKAFLGDGMFDPKEAERRGKGESRREEVAYFRLKERFEGFDRGTVLLEGRIIPAYPHIKRIVSLKGLKHLKGDRFYVEEKIDGYNLRVVMHKGKLYAFTRGGFLDFFSSEKVRELSLHRFFERFPSAILCGEMIGNTPFTPPSKDFDVKFLVFDVFENGSFWGVERRRKVLDRLGVAQVPLLGVVKREEVGAVVKRANRSRMEGVVLRDLQGGVLKYVCALSDILSIGSSVDKFFDMPKGFFYQRVLRSSIFIKQHALNRQKYSQLLGKAFLNLINALQVVEKGGVISEEFHIKFKDKRVWESVVAHMAKDVEIEVVDRWREGDYTHIIFIKKYVKTTKKLRALLNGRAFTD